ncbi:hypothetical protein ACFYXS_17700 [Streptomyces sp. NPDC002574]|uniref:hypothetical protein n=1 Tax=Streptomyces sp. NPDC002574 TaxID=3364652 RepID=UPI003692E9BB
MTTSSWVRLYGNPTRPVARAFVLVRLVMPLAILAGGIVRSGGAVSVVLGVLLLPPAGYGLLRLGRFMWRLTSSGVFVSGEGVRVLGTREVVVPWSRIAGFESRPRADVMSSAWTGVEVLWIVCTDGSAVPTRLSRGVPAAVSRRRTYERAVDTLDRMRGEHNGS